VAHRSSSSAAHPRFQECTALGVFEEFWENYHGKCDGSRGIKRRYQSIDGALRTHPTDGKCSASKAAC
jgi:hypothetical protein